MKGFTQKVAASVALGASVVHAITPITVKGNAFFAGDARFYIRGVDYQPGGASGADTVSGVADPIADAATCKRDIAYFKQLGLNTIRVYTVDNSANHDECMSALSDAGIYLALDVNSPNYSINRDDPAPSYNDVYLQNVFATMDAFAKYDNTLLFFSGNEIINNDKTTMAAPYIKAVIRDMKQYRGSQSMREIPIGYSAADVSENREQTAFYLNCGTDDARSDFFAFNDYSWCDPSSFVTSGWSEKVDTYKNYSIPLFLSEYGCIETPRHFQEVATLYSDQMTSVYSGGLVYEYSEEGSGYGLTTITGNTVKTNSDYTYLMNALKQTPSPTGDGGFHDDGTASECPAYSAHWEVKSDLLPAIPAPATKYMTDGAGKPPGLNGPGSQNAGTPSSGMAQPGSSDTSGGSGGDSGSTATNVHVSAVMGLVVLGATLFSM